MTPDRIDALDISVFDRIPSQTTAGDRRALLALQSATARRFGSYCYLEIGSHLGGSIQPHLLDPRCRRIYSIDPRPLRQPDNRGGDYEYPGNSTQRMLDGLRGVAGEAALRRLVTFECAAAEVDPARIADPPHLCFIDGEHTTAAVLADYAFCDRVRHADGAVCFHDAGVVWQAVRRIARDARRRRHGDRGAALLVLAGSVAALAFGDSPLRGDPAVEGLRRSPATVLLRSAAGALRRRRAA